VTQTHAKMTERANLTIQDHTFAIAPLVLPAKLVLKQILVSWAHAKMAERANLTI
jgi:hypothetical protein